MAINTEASLGDVFLRRVTSLRDFLVAIREEFHAVEVKTPDEGEQTKFLLERKPAIFDMLDKYFDEIWEDVSVSAGESVQQRKAFLEKTLLSSLAEGVETNTYIRQKPLGYAGDYVTMNFIYDYSGNRFFGKTLYAKLINNYTCNIGVSRSNIARKEYLKERILSVVSIKDDLNILSVGCGPAREITELLRDGRLTGPVTIHLLDLEKNAISFVEQELRGIDFDREKIKIRLHMLDLISIVKSKEVKRLFGSVDFVYVSGVFDYLSDRLAVRVLRGLSDVAGQELIVFNISEENASHRVYYEILGEWVMFHRTKEDVLAWSVALPSGVVGSLEDCPQCKGYWILKIAKRGLDGR